MSKDDNKSVFITGADDMKDKMLAYIQKELIILEADWYSYAGRYVIEVPNEKYESVLRAGKKYACDNGLANGYSWLDYQNEIRYPVSSCDVAYGFLSGTLLPKEEQRRYRVRDLWCEDEYTPPYLIEYFEAMQEFLKVDKINRHYKFSDNAMIIAPNSLDYEEQLELMKLFIEKYGYGPFERINPLTFTGKLVEPAFQYKKTK